MCGCGCDNCHSSFGGLNGLLGATLLAGSTVRVGFWLRGFVANADIVEGCLYASGAFTWIRISIDSKWNGDYLTVEATTYFDFANTEDVGGFIQQELLGCVPEIEITRRDAVVIDRTSGDFPTGEGKANPGDRCPFGYYDNGWFSVNCVPLPSGQVAPNVTGQCSWDKQSFGDYVACQFGLTPTKAAFTGILLALGAVIILPKVLR